MTKINYLLIYTLLLISEASFAITYEIIGPCSETPIFTGEYKLTDLEQNAGKTSVNIFEKNKIPYLGGEEGFKSILNTPTGIDSIETISETKIRAYGWCYSVNGAGPDVMANQYHFEDQNDKLVWFYAYSTYDNDKWLDYCVPSYKIKAAQFCTK